MFRYYLDFDSYVLDYFDKSKKVIFVNIMKLKLGISLGGGVGRYCLTGAEFRFGR